jgi:hypothetical protein
MSIYAELTDDQGHIHCSCLKHLSFYVTFIGVSKKASLALYRKKWCTSRKISGNITAIWTPNISCSAHLLLFPFLAVETIKKEKNRIQLLHTLPYVQK